jgi:uncharacterized coiled-coil protein SlyX
VIRKADLKAQIADLEATVAFQANQLNEDIDTIAELNATITDQAAQLAGNVTLLDASRSTITLQQQEIATLKATLAELDPIIEPPLTVRGAYGRDQTASGFDVMRSVGLTTITASPDLATLDELEAAGMRAIVWLGSYDRAVPNDFERSNSWVSLHVAAIAGHPAIAAYQITDEANGATDLGKAATDIAERGQLIKSLDPTKPTYLTLKTGSPWEPFADAADIYGLVTYPISVGKGYNEDKIPGVIANAAATGLPRIVAVMQDFGNAFYRLPTADELQHQFDQWAAAPNLAGYMLYHWNLADLDNQPDQLDVLRRVNCVGGLALGDR